MLRIFDKLNETLYPVKNETLAEVLRHMDNNDLRYCFIEHPYRTCTVEEKQEMISEREGLYSLFSAISIVKGSALSYHDSDKSQHNIVHFHDGATKIDFKDIKHELGIPKRRDLHFYNGNLVDLIGQESGEVSPIMPDLEKISYVTFDAGLLEKGKMHSRYPSTFDMAITQQLSLYANVYDVYNALNSIIGDKIRVVEKRSVS